ncbi:MAG: hypothetical protein ABWY29_13405 [Blastococcus sp.]
MVLVVLAGRVRPRQVRVAGLLLGGLSIALFVVTTAAAVGSF